MNETVTLTWPTVVGATNYDIQRSTNYESGFSTIGNSTTASYEDAPGLGTFCYRIIAKNSCGSASASAARCIQVAACQEANVFSGDGIGDL